jgi:hypothetical protein
MYKYTFRRSGTLGVACLAGTLFVATSSSAECDDKAKFLSQEYLLNKGDCAVNKAIESGEGVLFDAGKNLARAFLNAYVPALSSLLFGAGGDPFAADAAMIVNEIQETKKEIMKAIVDQALVGDGATWDSITNQATDWANPFYDVQTKINNLASLDSLIADLTTLRNRFETTNYGVWNLDAYAVAVQLELSLKADREALRIFDQGRRHGDTESKILSDAAGSINFAWTNMLDGSGQVFGYLNSLHMADFVNTSNSRFVDVQNNILSWGGHEVCSEEEHFRGYNVKANAHPLLSPPKVAYGIALLPYNCSPAQTLGPVTVFAQTYSTLLTGPGLNLTQPNASGVRIWSLTTGTAQWQAVSDVTMHPVPYRFTPAVSRVNAALDLAMNKHKADEALLYFAAGYGSIRPLMDKWKDAIGQSWNQQTYSLDTALSNYLRDNIGGTPGHPHFNDMRDFLFAILRGQAPSADEQRWSENYTLSNGFTELISLVDTTSIDKMGLSANRYDGYLKNLTSVADASADQWSFMASKILAGAPTL